jgi:hypothetical protein
LWKIFVFLIAVHFSASVIVFDHLEDEGIGGYNIKIDYREMGWGGYELDSSVSG